MNLMQVANEINSLVDKYKKKQLLFNICLGVSAVMLFILTFVAAIIDPKGSGGVMLFLVVGGLAVLAVDFKVINPGIVKLRKRLDTMYGNNFISTLFAEHFDNIYYRQDDGFQKATIDNMDIFPSGDYIYTSEDYLRGDYQGIHFETADVSIKDPDAGQGGCYIFKGRMFIIDTKSKQAESLKVFEKYQSYVMVPPRSQKVSLESVKFNDAFDVYSQNDHDAFWILTPQKQEALMELKEKYTHCLPVGPQTNSVSHRINFHYRGSKLYVTISGDMNAFNSTTYPIDIDKEKKKFEKDVNVIKDIATF